MSKKTAEKIVTRFAPSPTGFFHMGSARTALFNYVYAKKIGGTFIVRIEDTDKDRSAKEYERDILDSLKWLGIKPDTIERQSERVSIHKKYIHQLIESGNAYISKEEKGERASVIRFKNPNRDVVFTDAIRGEITFNTEDLGDFVIAKDMDTPLHHLAVVVDDFDMNVNTVIRGEDLLSNTPRQILIQEALGFARPMYAHLPLILAEDKSKLSKRHGAKSVSQYRSDGYLPEAVTNFLALLGWHPSDNTEVLSLLEFIDQFDIYRVQKSGAIFDEAKLLSLQTHYIHEMSYAKYKKHMDKSTIWNKLVDKTTDHIIPIIKERAATIAQLKELSDSGELTYFFADPVIPTTNTEILRDKRTSPNNDQIKEYLTECASLIEALTKPHFDPEAIKEVLWEYASNMGRGAVLWPLRVSLTGKERSPNPFSVAAAIGKKATLRRIEVAINLL